MEKMRVKPSLKTLRKYGCPPELIGLFASAPSDSESEKPSKPLARKLVQRTRSRILATRLTAVTANAPGPEQVQITKAELARLIELTDTSLSELRQLRITFEA